jgi:hypothetical protein
MKRFAILALISVSAFALGLVVGTLLVAAAIVPSVLL